MAAVQEPIQPGATAVSSSSDGLVTEEDFPLKFCTVCASNQNRLVTQRYDVCVRCTKTMRSEKEMDTSKECENKNEGWCVGAADDHRARFWGSVDALAQTPTASPRAVFVKISVVEALKAANINSSCTTSSVCTASHPRARCSSSSPATRHCPKHASGCERNPCLGSFCPLSSHILTYTPLQCFHSFFHFKHQF